MEITTILYQLIFMPLQLLFEEIYYLIGWKLTKDYGLAIIVLSLTVNLLVLPLYNRADAVQEVEREIDAKLRKGVEHIKKTFKGDEQLMMLQTYYRQNNYSPLDAIKGSISLFLEIPFFVAAYQFLSHLSVLQGASLGPIKDLSQPDALLQIAGMTINVMPLIMTAVNIAATALFVTNMPAKTKVQLYGLAFFFLVFLYKSPAGLVFYWTLNNLFNLCKTAVYKIWKPKQNEENIEAGTDSKFFFAGAAFMAILTGLLIPSAVISASAEEFMLKGYMDNPLWYLVSSFALGIGSFIIWLGVFYWLAEAKSKVRYECFVCGFSIIAIVTYMVWGRSPGLITPLLELSEGLKNSKLDKAVNGAFVLVVCIGLHFYWDKIRKYLYEALCIGCLAMLIMSGMNVYHAREGLTNVMGTSKSVNATENKNKIVLSKSGKNVIVIMLDGAIGPYVPYMLQEKPELKQVYSGFTYYSNSVSHGGHTLFGSPGLFGGYEYVPEANNKRSDKVLKDKHNEAMLMLPRLLHDNGYQVTVSTPPLLNYQFEPDYTILKDYPYIRGEYFSRPDKDMNSPEEYEDMLAKNKRNFFCYGLVRAVPVVMQGNIYAMGHYNRFDKVKTQKIRNSFMANNLNKSFMSYYQALSELPQKTKIVEDGNTYLSMTSDITHDGVLLQMPDYIPKDNVDNKGIAQYDSDIYTYQGRHLDIQRNTGIYHANMVAFLKIGEWFDYLKTQGVYDNTRIILVSDHGLSTGQIKELNLSASMPATKQNRQNRGDMIQYSCLLMVKDFGSNGFIVNDEFMTNADVPVLVTKDIVKNPINPFTGNAITNEAKFNKEQYVLESVENRFRHNKGTAFVASRWFAVKNNIWEKNNWRLAKEESVMPN